MRSIEANYIKIQDKNPTLGVYPCLVKAVQGRRFSRKNLVTAFKKIMPEDEYRKAETKELVDYLEDVTKLAEEVEN